MQRGLPGSARSGSPSSGAATRTQTSTTQTTRTTRAAQATETSRATLRSGTFCENVSNGNSAQLVTPQTSTIRMMPTLTMTNKTARATTSITETSLSDSRPATASRTLRRHTIVQAPDLGKRAQSTARRPSTQLDGTSTQPTTAMHTAITEQLLPVEEAVGEPEVSWRRRSLRSTTCIAQPAEEAVDVAEAAEQQLAKISTRIAQPVTSGRSRSGSPRPGTTLAVLTIM